MKYFLIIFLLLSFSNLCLGAEPSSEAKAIQTAYQVFGPNFMFFQVPSSGPLADKTFITVSKTKGPAKIAKQLAKIFKKIGKKETKILVYGNSEDKTKQVIKDALKINIKTKRNLSGLNLLYIGKKTNFQEIRPLLEKLQGKLFFRANVS